MKINLISILFLVIPFVASAQKVIPLYKGTPPGSESWTWSEAESDSNGWQTKVVYNVSKPTLTVFQPERGKSNGTALIIAPGGAFHALSINSEGFDVAKWLAAKGVTCFVLKYRLVHMKTEDPVTELSSKWGKQEFHDDNNAVIPLAIADGREAIKYVREHAAEYDIEPNRIGIMGFSAGGTVAAGSLFDYERQNRPNFAAPIYPFFPSEMIGTVDAQSPPLFIVTATNDGLALAPHSVDLYSAWLKNKRDAELHMYARGDHGFGMRVQNLPTDKWIERFAEWLEVQGLTKAPDAALKPFAKKEFVYNGEVLPYRILYPKNYNKSKKYPLVLLLHGGGERGDDNEKQLVHGANMLLKETNQGKNEAIIIAPQCPQDSYWSSANIDRSTQPLTITFDYNKPALWPLAAANELVKTMADSASVDKSRIYITGLSMGGMGTFESVFRYPGLYAAALPICGGGDVNAYDKRVKDTKFWIFHGADDAVVNVKLSRDMAAKLKKVKVPVKYTEYPGVNHNSWDNAFADPNFISWMFSQKKK